MILSTDISIVCTFHLDLVGVELQGKRVWMSVEAVIAAGRRVRSLTMTGEERWL